MKLYEIGQAFRDWESKIMANDGEVTDADMQEFENLNALANDKIDAYAVIIKECLSEAEILSQEADKLSQRARTKKAVAERLKKNLDVFMQSQGKEKFQSLKADISYRKSVAVTVDESVLPKKWFVAKLTPDKTAIKDFLKSGGKVKGCALVENKNIQIK